MVDCAVYPSLCYELFVSCTADGMAVIALYAFELKHCGGGDTRCMTSLR